MARSKAPIGIEYGKAYHKLLRDNGMTERDADRHTRRVLDDIEAFNAAHHYPHGG